MTQLKRTAERQHPLWQLTLMRWRIFAREPAAIFWTYGFPLALALALGIAFRNRPPEPIEVAVQASPGAEGWRDALAKSPSMHVRWPNAQEAHQALRSGKVSLVVSAGQSRTYEYDPTRPESRMARALVDDALQRAEGRTDTIPVKDQLVTEPGSRYIDFLIPGLLVGSRAQNTQTVAGLVNLVNLPMAICSGVFFSAARFPEVFQPLIKVLPLTALIEGVRAVMLDGVGPPAVAQQVTIMLVWGAVSFGIALRLFRWQ